MSLIALKCPSCGGDIQIDDGHAFGYCMYCGTKVFVKSNESKVKLEVSGTVHVKDLPTVENLSQRAEEYAATGDIEKSNEYYNRILDIDPENQDARTHLIEDEGLINGIRLPLEDVREIHTMVANGKKIMAIKLYRELTGQDLKSAKDAIDALTVNPALVNPPGSPASQQMKDSSKKGGCYIATAVYGSYDAPEVLVLRHYRDTVLSTTKAGRLFIRVYYVLSPPVANWLKNSRHINKLVKKGLDAKVRRC